MKRKAKYGDPEYIKDEWNEYEQELIETNHLEWVKRERRFTFGGKTYIAPINYAYLNEEFGKILDNYNIQYDKTWLWTESLNYDNYKDKMNDIVKRLFLQNTDKLVADEVVYEVINLIVKCIHITNMGAKSSLDISLIGIALDSLTNPEVHDILHGEHVHPSMTPEDIDAKKEEMLKRIKKIDLYGVSELLRAGEGIKADQVFNCIIGLWLRTRIHNDTEVAPRFVPERWIDGIRTRTTHFIETNNNRHAAITSKETIKDSGTENKRAGVLTQDLYIKGTDCGSVHGINVSVRDKKELKNLMYKYQMLDDGTLHAISMEDTHLIGKTIKIRSAMTCANKEGICATCFGSHHGWNEHTKLYNRDLGTEFARRDMSDASQAVLSVKHTLTPRIIPYVFNIINMSSGELSEDWSNYFDRNFDRIVLRDGWKAYMYAEDITNNTTANKSVANKSGQTEYGYIRKDKEYGEHDILRIRRFYITNEKGEVYQVSMETKSTDFSRTPKMVEFKVSGFPKFTKPAEKDVIIELTEDNEIRHIIPNKPRTSTFREVKKLYNAKSRDQITGKGKEDDSGILEDIDDLVNKAREILISAHQCSIELLFKNKVRDANNHRLPPDWRNPNVQYTILPEQSAINKSRSITTSLNLGYFANRLNDPFNYDPNNIINSKYDLLIDSKEEIRLREQYEPGDEEAELDFLEMINNAY